ncbi:group I intron endonuclease [Clostridium perfringens]|uniref:Group I intron endonuclease n=1 Tax=Clostridium perfringens TaxID=1502 RepID=A0A2X3IET7_CLOPF|nr:NUMOD3 domain-containing DNA-binding protein [Clostridium perfringens]SQC85436.1 group I intron endonuclease [Clostridium perfringens]
MNHYVYEITNNINGKKYIGKRTCKCPIEEDKYMGSGTLLLRAIDKYGIENFSKKILCICSSQHEAYKKEFEIIEKLKCYENHNNYYNIQHGGLGGWKGLKFSKETLKKMSEAHKGQNNYWYGKSLPKSTLEKARKVNKKRMLGQGNHFYGKRHSEQSKKIMSEKRRGENAWNTNLTEKQVKKIKWLIYEQKMQIKDIAFKFGVNERTISSIKNCSRWNHVKIYDENNNEIDLKKINYKKISQKYRIHPKGINGKSVICLNNKMIFNSCREASHFIGVAESSLNGCLKKRQKTSGKMNGQPARWMYYDEYLAKEGLNDKSVS